MRPRFLADANLKKAIIEGVRRREPSINFLTAEEAGLRGVPDPEVLQLGASEKRILVSHDFRTMPAHFGDFIASQQCAGVFLIAQSKPIGAAVEALVEIWALSEADEWVNRLDYLR